MSKPTTPTHPLVRTPTRLPLGARWRFAWGSFGAAVRGALNAEGARRQRLGQGVSGAQWESLWEVDFGNRRRSVRSPRGSSGSGFRNGRRGLGIRRRLVLPPMSEMHPNLRSGLGLRKRLGTLSFGCRSYRLSPSSYRPLRKNVPSDLGSRLQPDPTRCLRDGPRSLAASASLPRSLGRSHKRIIPCVGAWLP